MKLRILFLLTCISFLFNPAFAILTTPTQLAPTNGAIDQSPNVLLDWSASTGSTNYEVLYGTSPALTGAQLASNTTSSYTTANLLFNTTYYWKVRAIKNTAPVDSSAWSGIFSFTTVGTINNLTPVNGAINQDINALLDWSSVSGITGYLYQYDTDPAFNSPNLYNGVLGASSQITLGNLLFNTTYYWRARAYHTADTSNYGSVWSFTTLGSLNYIAPVNGASNQDINALLDWSSVSGITGYLYQYDTDPAFNSPNLYNGVLGASSQITLGNLLFNTTYYWRVRAYSATDTTAWQQAWSFTTLGSLNYIAPVNGASNQDINALLDWSSVSGITGYLYQYDTDPAFNSPNLYNGVLGASSQITLGNLLFNTTYYWRVRAYSATDTTAWQQVWSFTTVNLITHIAPINGSVGASLTPLLDWGAFSGILGYQYRYSDDSTFATASYGLLGAISQVNLAGLLYGTRYFWSVRAFHAADTSNWSVAWNFTTSYQMTSAPLLISPTNGASNISLSGVQLEIGSVANANDYQYQISANSNFSNYAVYISTNLLQATGALNPSTTYYWRARGRNAAGNSPWASPFSFTTVAGAPPAPVNVGPLDASTNLNWLGIILDWSQVAGATGYVLVFDDDINFSSPVTINTTDNFYSTGMLLPNTTYYWQVQAVNGSGSSGFSTVWSFTTGPVPAPVLISPSNNATGIATNGVLLTWSAVTGATSYFVEYADNAGFTGATGSTVATTSFALPALANNQSYYWHVYANYNAFTSVYSSTYIFTTVPVTTLQAPILISPANLAIAVPLINTNLIWQAAPGALSYDWEISTDALFTTVVSGNTSNTSALLTGLTDNTTYYWHVKTVDADTVSAWSTTFSFTTDILSGIIQIQQPDPVCTIANANHQIILSCGSSLYNAQYLIYNTVGQVIVMNNITASKTQIETTGWNRGVYFVSVLSSNKQQNFKVCIE